MGKHISVILNNLCAIGKNGDANVQAVCVQNGVAILIKKLSNTLIDYEMHVNLHKAFASLVLSTSP